MQATAAPLRILLAEDETVNRMAAVAMLRRAGHAVVAVEDGPAAVAAADGDGFDLILMDLGLPGFDGDEAVRQIRARPGAGRTAPRILMLTATATPGGLERCQDCGADGTLTKPLRLDALEAVLAGASKAGPADSAAFPVAFPVAFDPAAVGQMRELLPEARVAELIAKTATTLRQYRAALETAWTAGDQAAVGMMAHKVAGVSAQYGCVALRRAAQALEAVIERKSGIGDAEYRALIAAYPAALAYLDARSE